MWLLSRAGRVLQLCWCLAEEKQTVCRRHLMEGFPQTQANGNSSAVSLGASILDLGAAFCPLSRQLDPMGLTLHSLCCSRVSLWTRVLYLPWPMLTSWSLLPQPQSKALLLPQTLCFAGKELGASHSMVWAGIWGSCRVLPEPKESSWKHEWARGEATKRGIRKQKELFFGGVGDVCMREGRNFFSLPESLKCFLQCLRRCMGPRSITFLARPAEGDGPSTARLNEIPLTSPRKHPKSLAPLRLGTKVRVRGPTKGWGRKCWLPRQRCPGRLVLSARGPGFLPELQESEAIYFHCKTEALERGQGRLQLCTGLSWCWHSVENQAPQCR